VGDDKENPKQETFEQRLNRAQQKAQSAPEDEKSDGASNIAFRMGVDLVAGTGVGAFMGFWVDKWFDTKPLFFIVLFILGFVAGLRNVFVAADRMQAESDKAEKRD